MRARIGQGRRILGLAAAVLAILVVLAAGPGHVLEDSRGEHQPVAEAAVLARAASLQADWDHHIHGHQCADHCAAHVLNVAPEASVLTPSALVHAVWRASSSARGRSIRLDTPTRPPRA